MRGNERLLIAASRKQNEKRTLFVRFSLDKPVYMV